MMLDKLHIAQVRFTMTALAELRLPPYPGKVWRDAFGAVFRQLLCMQPHQAACPECLMRDHCAYAYIFATPIPRNAQVLRTQQQAPRPFVLEFVPGVGAHAQVSKGQQISVGMTLIGRAIEHLPYFIVVFQELGNAGLGRGRQRYRLDTVRATHQWTGAQMVIYEDGALVGNPQEILTINYEDVCTRARAYQEADFPHLSLDFVTPTRLKAGGRYGEAPEFHELVRGLLRRVSTVYYFHCGARWDADYAGLAARAAHVRTVRAATRWVAQERYSRRQARRVGLSGFVGELEYEGAVAEFMPLLLIGELVHVGKGTVCGNGQYVVQI